MDAPFPHPTTDKITEMYRLVTPCPDHVNRV